MTGAKAWGSSSYIGDGRIKDLFGIIIGYTTGGNKSLGNGYTGIFIGKGSCRSVKFILDNYGGNDT